MQLAVIWRGKEKEFWIERALPWQRGLWFDRVNSSAWSLGLGVVVLHWN